MCIHSAFFPSPGVSHISGRGPSHQYEGHDIGGHGQATKHGRRELLELCAAFGSSGTSRGDRGGTSLPDQPSWSPGDSEAHSNRERTFGDLAAELCRGRATRAHGLGHGAVRPRGGERPKRLEPRVWAGASRGGPRLPASPGDAPAYRRSRPEGGGGMPPGGKTREVGVQPTQVLFWGWWWARAVPAGPVVNQWGSGDLSPCSWLRESRRGRCPLDN
ncbi:hypothetical protein NDU88_008039 [Pleurodeles waltl]|uniref:Uncharacterized protein n=1 Tax=Pleurodeles waltl TaxID=8319 RepID=A0AAV7QME6_PLEWA|nr:hypothetical protein NDU88_008039 [Pleurodeles waltl]